jgi:hypothetical protein
MRRRKRYIIMRKNDQQTHENLIEFMNQLDQRI